MAGMLPGVEAARRRRFHNSYFNGSSELSPNSTCRRPSFSLYATGHESLPNSSMQRNFSINQKGLCDESRLDAAAREAKKRLDERLQPQRKSQTKRKSNGEQSSRSSENIPTVRSDSQSEVPKLRKNRSQGLNWLKISWKSSEQEECAVCLEQFKGRRGGTLMQLPCAHRFHTECLVPWLEGNAHCPCCRMALPS